MKRQHVVILIVWTLIIALQSGASAMLQSDQATHNAYVTQSGQTWQLGNDVMSTAISFADASVHMTSFYNKLAGVEYLTGPGQSELFYYKYSGSDISSNDHSWRLDKAVVSDIDLYGKSWGKTLELTVSRTEIEKIQVSLIFEIYHGQAGLRYQTYIKNNDPQSKKTISASDVIGLNFPNKPKTIYYIKKNLDWTSTTGSLIRGTRNALTRYDTGDGWIVSPESNYATSMTTGDHKALSSDPFLLINAWAGIGNVKVSTNPNAVQLVLFPNEEVEYFAINMEVFQGDQWDGRLAVERHLRQRYKFHDVSRVISVNDWYFLAKPGIRNESYYRDKVVPVMADIGFDKLLIDGGWSVERDFTLPSGNFSANLPKLADWVISQGVDIGYWFSMTGGPWGGGRDVADKSHIDLKIKQIEQDLIGKYKSTWQQVDLGEFWMNGKVTTYSHPSDSVYRKWINTRAGMNYITHKYPDYVMQTTCELENAVVHDQSLGLLGLPDNGIAGLFWGAEKPNYDPVKTMFGYYGLFPSEGVLDFWTIGQWKGTAGQFYSFLLSRHASIYDDPAKFTENAKANFKLFNQWRKNPRVESILNEILLPVYNGPVGNNAGPYSWMFTNEDKSNAILVVVGGENSTADRVDLNLRWLDDAKTYLIQDISLDDDGEFNYAFVGKRTGAQLKQEFSVNLEESMSRGKAYWIQELQGVSPQVLYADHLATSYTERWDGARLTVNVTGVPQSNARVIVYKDNLGAVEEQLIRLDEKGLGTGIFDQADITETPVRLKALSNTVKAINLFWVHQAADVSGFTVQKKIGEQGVWADVATVPAGTLRFADADFKNGQEYYYRIKAEHTGGEAFYSNQVTVVAPKVVAMEVVLDDDFEAGTAEGWTPWGMKANANEGRWSVVTGVNGSKVYTQSPKTPSAHVYSYKGDLNWSDYIVEADIRYVNGARTSDVGLIVGEDIAGNLVLVDFFNGSLRIVRRETFVWATPAATKPYTWPLGQTKRFKVVVDGTVVTLYVDGVQQLQLDTGRMIKGRIGLSSYLSAVEFDNVKVTRKIN